MSTCRIVAPVSSTGVVFTCREGRPACSSLTTIAAPADSHVVRRHPQSDRAAAEVATGRRRRSRPRRPSRRRRRRRSASPPVGTLASGVAARVGHPSPPTSGRKAPTMRRADDEAGDGAEQRAREDRAQAEAGATGLRLAGRALPARAPGSAPACPAGAARTGSPPARATRRRRLRRLARGRPRAQLLEHLAALLGGELARRPRRAPARWSRAEPCAAGSGSARWRSRRRCGPGRAARRRTRPAAGRRCGATMRCAVQPVEEAHGSIPSRQWWISSLRMPVCEQAVTSAIAPTVRPQSALPARRGTGAKRARVAPGSAQPSAFDGDFVAVSASGEHCSEASPRPARRGTGAKRARRSALDQRSPPLRRRSSSLSLRAGNTGAKRARLPLAEARERSEHAEAHSTIAALRFDGDFVAVSASGRAAGARPAAPAPARARARGRRRPGPSSPS